MNSFVVFFFACAQAHFRIEIGRYRSAHHNTKRLAYYAFASMSIVIMFVLAHTHTRNAHALVCVCVYLLWVTYTRQSFGRHATHEETPSLRCAASDVGGLTSLARFVEQVNAPECEPASTANCHLLKLMYLKSMRADK